MKYRNYSQYEKMVGDKLNFYKGKLINPRQRDADRGFAYTAQRIMTSSKNLFFSMNNEMFEPVEAMFSALTDRPGMADVQNVAGVNVVDISILSTIQSILGYVALERAMDKPIDTIYYQTLVAANAAGGFSKGDTVVSPFKPISPAINLLNGTVSGEVEADDSASTDEAEIELGKNLLPGSVVLVAKLADDVIGTGSDLKKDGIIYFDSATFCTSASVNYDTGVVTILDLAIDTTVTKVIATATVDATADDTGAGTLVTKPKMVTTQLVSKPNRVVLNSSFEDAAYMNKQTYDLQSAGVSMDFGKRAILQLLDAFTASIDYRCIAALYTAMTTSTPSPEVLDLTTYSLAGSEASTNNDQVNNYIIKLNKQLQKASGRGPAAYVVDTEGAGVLGNNPMYFTANANFDQQLNGVIGTYRGIPVIRNVALDGKLDPSSGTSRFAFIGAVHKTADGQAGPIAFGEYLPPYSVRPAINYDNPSQFSQGLFAQNEVQVVAPELSSYIKVKLVS